MRVAATSIRTIHSTNYYVKQLNSYLQQALVLIPVTVGSCLGPTAWNGDSSKVALGFDTAFLTRMYNVAFP